MCDAVDSSLKLIFTILQLANCSESQAPKTIKVLTLIFGYFF